jgi:hypothetical protein
MIFLSVRIDRHDCPADKRLTRAFVPLALTNLRCYEGGNQETSMTRATIFAILIAMAMLSILGGVITSARMLGWF